MFLISQGRPHNVIHQRKLEELIPQNCHRRESLWIVPVKVQRYSQVLLKFVMHVVRRQCAGLGWVEALGSKLSLESALSSIRSIARGRLIRVWHSEFVLACGLLKILHSEFGLACGLLKILPSEFVLTCSLLKILWSEFVLAHSLNRVSTKALGLKTIYAS